MKRLTKRSGTAFIVAALFFYLLLRTVYPADAAGAGETVELTVGRKIYYGTYATNYFDVGGKAAYCLEPLKDTPGSGRYSVQPLESGSVRKGLYYAYGGPGYSVYRERFGSFETGGGDRQDEEYWMSHCILSYLYLGNDSAFTGLGSSTIKALKEDAEQILSLPEPPEAFYAFLFNIGGKGQVMGGSGNDRTGGLRIVKRSNRPEWTADNPCYSLEGAVFGVYRQGEAEPAWTVTTDVNGCGEISDIPIGIYEIAELESPRGFAGSRQRQEIRVEEGAPYVYQFVNQAQYYPMQMLLSKADAETGLGEPQRAASFEGAEFTVNYYTGYYDSVPEGPGAVPERTWTLRTNARGELWFTEECRVSGDEFYQNDAGENVLPLGTVTVQEVKAPEGYLLNDTVYVEKVQAQGSGETDTIYHLPEVPEQVIRGDLQIVKFGEDEDEEEDQKTSLEGIVFTVTSKTTGEQIQIVTDENGYASTEGVEEGKGGLIFDTYLVSEENAPEGFVAVDDFEITISEEGQTLSYILEDKRVFSPVRLVKKDADSGEVIPAAGTEFQLLDEERNPISMSVHYPQETVHSTFQTDESGSFILPERLSAGIYYFQEIQAPEGYVISREPVRFEITEDHEWGDPFVIEFTDRPVMGQICIKKTDSVTGQGVGGAKFEIWTKEDILTPAGNIRMPAGSLAGVIVTGEDGSGRLDSLYLGKYEIREIEQPPGYVLAEEGCEVELQYKDQETELVTVNLELPNQPTEVILRKTEEGTENELEGVEFSVWRKTETGDAADEKRCVTDEEGRIVLRYLTPGTYCVRETEPLPGYLGDDAVWEFTVDTTGRIDGEDRMEYKIENQKTRISGTRALWKESGTKEIYAGEDQVIVDTVSLENLKAGQEYILRGVLADADTGEPLEKDFSPAPIEKRFTAESASQDIRMEFTLDSARVEEKRIVVFESLYIGDILIFTHSDPDDGEQTVSIMARPETAAPTGDSPENGYAAAVSAAVLSLGACFFICFRKSGKRRRKKQSKVS